MNKPDRHDASQGGNTSSPWRVVQLPESFRHETGASRGRAPAAAVASCGTAQVPHNEDVAANTRREADPRRKALELLTRREHSRRELCGKLRARGFDAEVVAQTIDEMSGRGWQDESRFAHTLARSRVASGHGPLRIRAELQQHAIADAIIEAALSACETDWNARAAELVQRRFGLARAHDRKEIARRGAFLQRRGFDLDAIRHALGRGEG